MYRLRVCILLAIATLTIPVLSTTTYALDTEFFSKNTILVYNPDGNCVSDSSATSANGENKDYLGGDIYSADVLAKIKQYQPLYEKAVASEGYPWQILAVLHYQETGLSRTNPANGQGLFQDFSKKYPDLYKAGAEVNDTMFLQQAARAIEIYNGKIESSGVNGMKKVTKDDIKNKDPDSIKEIFLMYNGLGGGHYADKASALGYGEKIYEGSPYVMNQADAARDPRHPDKMNKAWPGAYVADGVYDANATMSRPGTYVQFAGLANLPSSGSCGTDGGGVVAGNILETAKNLAWDQPAEPHSAGTNFKSLAKQSFVDAVAKYTTLSQESAPGSNSTYADCGKFVGTVMRASGADTDYPQAGTAAQYAYVTKSDKYQIITSPKQSDLRPGDILVSAAGGHTAIYAGEIGVSKSSWSGFPAGSKLVLIEAALDSRVPSWVPSLSYTLGLSGVVAARMK